MGSSARPRPAKLADKLLEIRNKLVLSQNGMIRRMGLVDEIIQADVSAYELDLREPPLKVLLQYARAANISVESLIDDELDLPERLPANPKSEGIRRKKSSRTRN